RPLHRCRRPRNTHKIICQCWWMRNQTHAGESEDIPMVVAQDAGDSQEAMLLMMATNAVDSARAGDSTTDTWVLSTLAYVFQLAQSSMPPVGSLLSVNASMLLNPNLIHEGENWIESVGKSMHRVKGTLLNLCR
ncbi:MAG: hypothetical protein ACKPKO_38160, partial [Candidatus Fonsibacter sp.]